MSNRNTHHLERISLKNDGVFQEILVMKKDSYTGDIYYIATNELDPIDKQRIIKILHRRDANSYPLYDLFYNETLANGMNALEYFHQLVKIRTRKGEIFPVGSGKTGEPIRQSSSEVISRGPGRPPKSATE